MAHHREGKIALLLADDHAILRQGLRALLEAEDDMEVVGEAEDGRQAVEMALRLHPSVVVMDIAMPLLNGVHATRLIREKDPHVKVIVLSMYAAEEFVTQSIASGASGYLVKQYAAAELLLAIREVVKGHAYFSPSVSRLLVEKLGRAIRGEEAVQPMSPLTYREIEVLQLISEGLSNKDISVELDISVKTVEKHRGHIMSRLNIHDVAGLTRYAISRGIIGADLETGKISS